MNKPKVHVPKIRPAKKKPRQRTAILTYMLDSGWHTLEDIAFATGYSTPSVSARLRDLRKACYGSFWVGRRYAGTQGRCLWEYAVSVDEPKE